MLRGVGGDSRGVGMIGEAAVTWESPRRMKQSSTFICRGFSPASQAQFSGGGRCAGYGRVAGLQLRVSNFHTNRPGGGSALSHLAGPGGSRGRSCEIDSGMGRAKESPVPAGRCRSGLTATPTHGGRVNSPNASPGRARQRGPARRPRLLNYQLTTAGAKSPSHRPLRFPL